MIGLTSGTSTIRKRSQLHLVWVVWSKDVRLLPLANYQELHSVTEYK